MQVKDIMTKDPACCGPNARLQEVAKLMVDNDCGEIPVVENQKLVGVVTDRDICCRTVAKGKNPLDMTASEVMTAPAISVAKDASIEECCRKLEDNQIRRVPVVDEAGRCCGIVAQADIANYADSEDVAEVVEKISEPGTPQAGS
jgi:CBS domain-containing protein